MPASSRSCRHAWSRCDRTSAGWSRRCAAIGSEFLEDLPPIRNPVSSSCFTAAAKRAYSISRFRTAAMDVTIPAPPASLETDHALGSLKVLESLRREAHQPAVPRRSCRQPVAHRGAERGARASASAARSMPRRCAASRMTRSKNSSPSRKRSASNRSPTANIGAPPGRPISWSASTASNPITASASSSSRGRSRDRSCCGSRASSAAFPAIR